jgi:hypothetical protein
MKNILISGMSGLIGGILRRHLERARWVSSACIKSPSG